LKKTLLIGLLTLVIAAPLLTIVAQRAFAEPDPMVGLGYIFDVSPSGGMEIPGSKKWKVQQGVTATVALKEVEFPLVDVWVAGAYTNGIPWKIQVLDDYSVVGGTVVFSFTFPLNAGCTGVFQYKDSTGVDPENHVAAVYSASQGQQEAGGFKMFDSQWNPAPCVPGVPELSLGSAVVTSIGLVAALALRRRHQKK